MIILIVKSIFLISVCIFQTLRTLTLHTEYLLPLCRAFFLNCYRIPCENLQLEYVALAALLCGDGSKMQAKCTVVDFVGVFFCYDFQITPESERRVSYLSSYLGNVAWHLSLTTLQSMYMHAAVTFLLSSYHPVCPVTQCASDPTGESCSLHPHCVLCIPTPICNYLVVAGSKPPSSFYQMPNSKQITEYYYYYLFEKSLSFWYENR